MSELDPTLFLPFRVTETVDAFDQNAWLVDGNSAEAEALSTEEFWELIVGKSRITAFTPSISQNLQEFFGKQASPDGLIVASPLKDDRARTPIRMMVASCTDNIAALHGDTNQLYLPAYDSDDKDHDTLISVTQGDWHSNVPHHDSPRMYGYTVFRASRAKLPKDFLFPVNGDLTRKHRETMREGLAQA